MRRRLARALLDFLFCLGVSLIYLGYVAPKAQGEQPNGTDAFAEQERRQELTAGCSGVQRAMFSS